MLCTEIGPTLRFINVLDFDTPKHRVKQTYIKQHVFCSHEEMYQCRTCIQNLKSDQIWSRRKLLTSVPRTDLH